MCFYVCYVMGIFVYVEGMVVDLGCIFYWYGCDFIIDVVDIRMFVGVDLVL